MHRLVFVTDIHLTEGIDSVERFARDLEEIRALEPRPDLGAIAGGWWSQLGFAECPDGSPRGYLIADIEGADVRLRYQAAGCAAEYRARVFAHGEQRYVNVFFGDAGAEVALRVADGWLPLQRETGLVMRERWTSAHIWRIPSGLAEPVAVKTAFAGSEIAIEDVPFVEEYMNDEEDRRI